MKVTRLGSSKNMHNEVNIIDVEIEGKSYRLTHQNDGRLRIHANDGNIAVNPCCANEIDIDTN